MERLGITVNCAESTNQSRNDERAALNARIAELERKVWKVEEIERAQRESEDQFRKVFDYSTTPS